MLEKIQRLLKITKFQGDLCLADGTNLVIDGNFFNAGVTVSVQTKDGLTLLPNGSYTLLTGDIMNVKNGKVVEIISPIINKPVPDPEKSDEEMGIGMSPNEVILLLATDPTTVPAPATPVVDSPENSTTTETPKVLTPEEISAKLTEIEGKLTDFETRLASLEGTGTATADTTTQMKKDLQIILEKATFSNELKTNPMLETKDSVTTRMDLIRKIINKG